MRWIKQLFKSKQEPTEINLLCSACSKAVPIGEVHVIPWWNTEVKDFLTTYRCGECWQKSLAETRTKIKVLDDDAREKFCEFLERHGYVTDAQSIRQESLDEASQMIETVLDAIECGDVQLTP